MHAVQLTCHHGTVTLKYAFILGELIANMVLKFFAILWMDYCTIFRVKE